MALAVLAILGVAAASAVERDERARTRHLAQPGDDPPPTGRGRSVPSSSGPSEARGGSGWQLLVIWTAGMLLGRRCTRWECSPQQRSS